MKIVVLGLDGTGFELIDPWIKDGTLPNIKKLIENGCSSDLESCLPPVTSPNWKCYSTGKNPGKLGIYWWENINLKEKKISFPRERVNLSKELWDYIGESGKKVGVINMPTTHPPKKVNGFLISDGLGVFKGITYPKELETILKSNYNYKIYPESLSFIDERSEEAAKEIHEVIKTRFRVAQDLFEKYDLDFLHLTIFYINTLHHHFWNNKYTKEGWKIIDKNIGYFIRDDINVFIMSDHGSNPIKHVFYINTWLKKEGYLSYKKKIRLMNFLFKMGVTKQNLTNLAKKMKIAGVIKKFISPEQLQKLPSEAGTVDVGGKVDLVDWNKTKAIASGQGPVYINSKGGNEKERVVSELIDKLKNLKNPSTGMKIAANVYRKEEIYSGEYIEEAPDIIIDQFPGTHIRGGIDITGSRIFEQPMSWRAENKRHGILIAYGPDIKKGLRLENASILDLTPTILYMMGVSIPEELDGKVLTEIIREESPIKDIMSKKKKYTKVDRGVEKEKIKGTVKKIGLKKRIKEQ